MLKLTPKPDPNAPKSAPVNLPAGDFTPGLEYKKHAMQQSFFENLKDFFTERPVKVGKGSKDDAFAPVEFENGFADNFKEWSASAPKPTGGEMVPRGGENAPGTKTVPRLFKKTFLKIQK